MVNRMKKILYSCLLLVIFFSFNSKVFAKSLSEEFIDVINSNYDCYNIEKSENNTFGDIIIVNGIVDKRLSLSIYYKHDNDLNDCLQIKEVKGNYKRVYTFSKDSMVEEYFNIKLKFGYEYEVLIVDKDLFLYSYSFNLGSYENINDFEQKANFKGLGLNNFESSDKLTNNVYNLKVRNLINGLKEIGIVAVIGGLIGGLIGLIVFGIIKGRTYSYRYHLRVRPYKHRKYIYTLDKILRLPSDKLYGKTICFQTDTVYGIGAKILDKKGISKIYLLKNREANKPLAVLAADINEVIKYIKQPSKKVIEIMKKYWPGALTIVFESKYSNETIAFRIPNNEYTIKLLKHFGPLSTTSVNISGEEPLNSIEDIDKVFGRRIDYIVKFPEELPSSNVSSTVIKVVNDEIIVLRQGDVVVKLDEEIDV